MEVRALYGRLSRRVANLPTLWAGLARHDCWTTQLWLVSLMHEQQRRNQQFQEHISIKNTPLMKTAVQTHQQLIVVMHLNSVR